MSSPIEIRPNEICVTEAALNEITLPTNGWYTVSFDILKTPTGYDVRRNNNINTGVQMPPPEEPFVIGKFLGYEVGMTSVFVAFSIIVMIIFVVISYHGEMETTRQVREERNPEDE